MTDHPHADLFTYPPVHFITLQGEALPLSTEVFRLAQDEALPTGRMDLFQAGERESFDLSADWFRLLESKAMFPGIETRPYVLKRNDEVRGLLLLATQRSLRGGRRVQSFTNYYSSLYRPLLASLMSTEELTGYLSNIQAKERAAVMRFDAMDPAHPTFALLASALQSAGLQVFRFFGYGNWYLPVEGRSFDEYFKSLSSQVHNTVRRREKKFLAAGRGQLKIVTEAAELEQAIAAWREIYQASWKIPEPFPEFVPGLIRLCAERGWLRLGLAYYDGKAVAAQLWIVSHGRAVIYKLAYDEKFAKLSTGTVLTAHLMRHVLDTDQVHEVDYLIGDDSYKKDWMSHRRERWGIVAYNPRTIKGLWGAGREMLARSVKWLLKRVRDSVKFFNVK